MRIHLDTDLGGDTDDACALALLLRCPDADLVGVTTSIDDDGLRAGCVGHCLALDGRADVPVAAGAAAAMATRRRFPSTASDERYWPGGVRPLQSAAGAALDLLADAVEQHATIVAIGPYTNLGLLEVMRPGSLARTRLVLMGGWVDPPVGGLPAWGPDMDFNVQADPLAARIVLEAGADVTLVTLPATLAAPLRARDLPRLRAAGPLQELLARQAESHAADFDMPSLGRRHDMLPDDLLNFQYDAVACSTAIGWDGVTLSERRLRLDHDDGLLRLHADPDGIPVRVVDRVDGERFAEEWLDLVTGRT